MKKILLVSIVAAISMSTTQAAPTIYGKAFLTVDYANINLDSQPIINDPNRQYNNNQEKESVQINSNVSQIGFRGSEAITANTDVVYQLEYGINIAGSDSDNIDIKSRDTYLGLVNKDLGQFRFGRNYSVTDYVNNVHVTEGYWYNLGSSNLNSDGSFSNALTLTDGTRINNSIVWIAPKYKALPLELALQYGANKDFGSDKDSGFGASLMFDPGAGFTAGVAYDKDMSINGDILRGSASIDLGKYIAYPVTLGALYQQADYNGNGSGKADVDNDATEKAIVLSAEMGLSNFARPASFYLQYDKTDNLGGLDANDADQIVVGGKYKFKKNIIAHGYAGYNSANLNNGLLLLDNSTNSANATFVKARGDAEVFAIGGGLEYLF